MGKKQSKYLTDTCPKCYWFETNGLTGEDEAFACRSPKWEWTDEEMAEHQKKADKNHWYIYNTLPDFDPKKHCDFYGCARQAKLTLTKLTVTKPSARASQEF